MRILPVRLRLLCAVSLILAGACGILFAPTVGLLGGKEVRSFALDQLREHAWGISVITSEVELPFVHNQRGLVFMNVFMAGSLGAVFGGVHWLAGLRRKLRDP